MIKIVKRYQIKIKKDLKNKRLSLGDQRMNWFEYLTMGFCLSISPNLLWNKKIRKTRKYILNEIRQGRGIL